MKKIQLFALFIAFAMATSCKSEEANPEQSVSGALLPAADLRLVNATLAGTNEVPAVTTSARGTAIGNYSTVSKILNLTVAYEGMTPTAGHIHNGASGANGPIAFGFTNFTTTPFTYVSPLALAADQETALLAGNNYVNLHSARNPGGEIRGQLALTQSGAQGTITGKYNNSTKVLTLQISYLGIIPTMWHIHKGAVGVAGPVVIDLGNVTPSPLNFSTPPLTAVQEADLKSGLYYVNIHSAAVPNGEIRAQLSVK
jgi:hypothetical protein